ncbi:unnamed protein product [Arctogadus glacialis]
MADTDVGRAVYAPERLTERVVQMFRSKTEFTFLASIQQKASTSGVIFSIHESEHSYFELESSGVREEIRYHYRSNGKPRSESFPYRLADGQWHKIALTVSATHLLLHVDCNSSSGLLGAGTFAPASGAWQPPTQPHMALRPDSDSRPSPGRLPSPLIRGRTNISSS